MARLVSMLSSEYEPPPRTLKAPTLAARVGAELHAVDAGAARARIDIEIGAHIAGHEAGAPRVAEARIDTREEPAEPAPQRRGIAIAVGMAPAAETLRPEGEIARGTACAGRSLGRVTSIGVVRRVGQCRTAEAERAKITGNAGIRTLPHAAEHRAARELRFLALRVVHAAEHFAGERIERLPGTGDGLIEHGDDERIGDRAPVERRCHRRLIARLRHRGKSEAGTGRATTGRATACIAAAGVAAAGRRIVAGERQENIVGIIAERRREKGKIAGDAVERGGTQATAAVRIVYGVDGAKDVRSAPLPHLRPSILPYHPQPAWACPRSTGVDPEGANCH